MIHSLPAKTSGRNSLGSGSVRNFSYHNELLDVDIFHLLHTLEILWIRQLLADIIFYLISVFPSKYENTMDSTPSGRVASSIDLLAIEIFYKVYLLLLFRTKCLRLPYSQVHSLSNQ